MEICTKCKIEKPESEFYRARNRKSGLTHWCKDCSKAASKAYRRTEKGKVVQIRYQRAYNRTKKGKRVNKASCKKYYDTIIGYLRHCFSNVDQRCNNPKDDGYKYYGGRGIKCKFTSDGFVDYVINVLQVDPRGLQVDRIDNDGHYEPGNIRFVTAKENCNNKGKYRKKS